MSTIIGSADMAGSDGLALVPVPPQPWYTTPEAILHRQELEDEHSRILANAVGDHLPCELALRAASIAEQLQRCA